MKLSAIKKKEKKEKKKNKLKNRIEDLLFIFSNINKYQKIKINTYLIMAMNI